ncbi:trypsin-like peptidase domain-containing protein [Streptomyces spirodelae]|uniref:Trypsin-like peptidase domain-containing protein n=1 Tax=Streptomyces spirodelae TaxID=2812904 RepID=A0ABS3WV74_9ACTN|nr:trypsin-like peptidase domain-containing protein [Streptomyces spirodelae]MBO8187004.1 trypsin-like peptidase domain-containing protein [Streptomyces spirodelae]
MDEPKATGQQPKWWSRPRWAPGGRPTPGAEAGPAQPQAARTATGTAPVAAGGTAPGMPLGTEAEAAPRAEAGEAAAAPVPAARPEPLHGVDPYSTPPYGGPGPWAPAPPVQRPSATPPQGVALPPGSATPPYGVPTGGPDSAPGTLGGGAGQGAPGNAPGAPRNAPGAPGAAPGGTPAAPSPQPPVTALDAAEVHEAPQALQAPRFPEAHQVPQVSVQRSRRRSRIVVGGLVLALVAGGAGGLIGAYVERNGNVSDVKLPQTAAGPAGEGGERPEGSIAGIARRTLPGVVTLHTRGGGAEATGTGFVLDRRGHILTNNHVVESAEGQGAVRVTFDGGQTATGEVIGSDSGYDLAVIKVSHVSGLTPLPLGNSDSVRVGDPVIAFGAPFDLDGTVTTGIVSARERPITAGGEEPGSELSYVDALQTDAPINPGNSGGPLVDSRGRVIGVNSAIKGGGSDSVLPDGEGGGGGSVGLGFAIPVNQARRVAEELINEGRATHPVIGISLDMEYEGEGARIGGAGGNGGNGEAVVRGGPADKAGLKEGDVITKVGDKLVSGGEELIVRIRSHRPGDKLKLTVRRGGSGGAERTVRVTLGSATG